ncbi:MAG: type II toxin-antitoxin system HicB family antitoxin [Thermodesulfobacteriota bacterium]|nr:type II toxin-antitoxin system HicB family antitoxin [Thermodesulfobacteriota bacterium]
MDRTFNVIVEKDSDGFYVSSVPELQGCHTQAKSLDELLLRTKEVIALCLEVEEEPYNANKFIGVQRLSVSV